VLRDVALEVKLGTLRNQALAAFLAAALDAVAAGFCGHACAETVAACANYFAWLESTFHLNSPLIT
jgi:hypothetical protein